MKDLHKDRIETAAVTIQEVLDDPDKETAELVKEAREQYDSKCTHFPFLHTRVCTLSSPFPARTRIRSTSMNLRTLVFQSCRLVEKLHDLSALLNFDATKLSGEVLGAESVRRHQETLQEHWSSMDMPCCQGTTFRGVY